MREFFISISAEDDNSHISLAKAYLEDMFPDSECSVFREGDFSLVYSSEKNEQYTGKPLLSRNRNAALCVSGEYDIPGYLLKTNSPGHNAGEIIIALFEEHGVTVFQKFSGNFNILVCYYLENRLIAINSKLSLYPLYYYQNGNTFLASGRLGVFKMISGKNTVNWPVVMQHCLYNYPVSSQTFIKDVKLQASASILTFENNKLTENKYWKIGDEMESNSGPMNFNDSVDLLDGVLTKTIKKKCSETDRLGISLTGGWDGRLLLAYALKYLSPGQILLYSHGTRESPDIVLPLNTSRKLGYKYLPVLLDDPGYKSKQLFWANETIKYSDGLRQISRVHYLYNMSVLRHEHNINNVISGIGGSNLIKSSNYRACDVFNDFVINLIESQDFEPVIRQHYDYIISHYPHLFPEVDFNSFLASFDDESFKFLHAIQNKTGRFLHFLISEIERKYFGSEIQSYKHLVKNYSPFFDDLFIQSLMQTVFSSAESNKGLIKSHYLALVYGKLITRHNISLAKEKTDRGFSMYDVSSPFRFPVLIYKYVNNRINRVSNSDYFNNKDISRRFINQDHPDLNYLKNSLDPESAFLNNFISAISYFKI